MQGIGHVCLKVGCDNECVIPQERCYGSYLLPQAATCVAAGSAAAPRAPRPGERKSAVPMLKTNIQTGDMHSSALGQSQILFAGAYFFGEKQEYCAIVLS